jgi:hypothetical protein
LSSMGGLRAAFNPAGGVFYHLRAMRHAAQRWQPFRVALADWLESWKPPERALALVGPSAGYTLPVAWLGRFERLLVLEPDPLARWLLAQRLARVAGPGPQLEFVPSDHFVHHSELLLPLLVERGQPAVLFCNVVGQLMALLGPRGEVQLEKIRDMVSQVLAGRSWASYHDRVSGSPRPILEQGTLSVSRWSDEALLRGAYGVAERDEATAPRLNGNEALPRPAELLDHYTEGFFPPSLPHRYFSWELERGTHHLIEGVYQIAL